MNEILKLDIGSYTKPINTAGGTLILKINNIKEVSVKNIDKELELSKIINAEKNRQLNEFSVIHYKKLKTKLMSKNFNPIIVVAGEPKVFLELYLKSFNQSKIKPLLLICSQKLLLDQMKLLKINKSIRVLDFKDKINFKNLNNKKINLIDVDLNYTSLKNIKLKDTNIYIEECFDIALDLLKKTKILFDKWSDHKKFLKNKYQGITEYLGARYKKLNEVVMLIYNKNLSVSPLTTHISLKNGHKSISKKKIINHVKKINEFYRFQFNKKPKIAITGLNPHCESYSKTNEEDMIIKPMIKFLKKKRFKISGPFPADTVFLSDNIKKFDVVIGMYHDQVLTPMKSIYEFDAINITLGLPFIRVSPDHGPNLSMFGKNKSSSKSLIRSIEFLNK